MNYVEVTSIFIFGKPIRKMRIRSKSKGWKEGSALMNYGTIPSQNVRTLSSDGV